jgi:tetratricopeptide (TPR) repeat protein
MKKLIIILGTVLLVVFWGFVLSTSALMIRHVAVKASNDYEQKALNTKNTDTKLLYFLKSNSIVQSDDKIVSIADLYLKKGDTKNALLYLSKANTQDGRIKYLELQVLTNGFDDDQAKLLGKIDNENIKNEYNALLKYPDLGEINPSIISQPASDLGRLLSFLETEDLTKLNGSYSITGKKLIELNLNPKLNQVEKLEVAADILEQSKLYKQEIGLLTSILKNHPENTVLLEKRALVYNLTNNSEKALEDYQSLQSADPSRKSYYKQASDISSQKENRGQTDYFQRTLDWLISITK